MRKNVQRAVMTVVTALLLSACPSSTDAVSEPKEGRPPAVGDMAPGGTVTALDGSRVDLAATWKTGTTVVVFYRGHW
jgi:hypothetical protein